MGARARSLALLAALGVGLLAGCDAGGGSPRSEEAPVSKAASSILHLMLGASQRLEFQGVRRYELHYTGSGAAQVLSYRELVSADGEGGQAIDPLELIEPVVSPAQVGQFMLLQKLRQKLHFRYRDFELRDLDAFAANYVAVQTGQLVQVAGRTAERLRIQRSSKADRRFLVDVDRENGLVLRAREERIDGSLVSLSEFESLDLTPDLSSVVFAPPLSGEQTLPPGSAPLAEGLGFQPPVPKQVPSGWDLIEVAKLLDPLDDRAWAKLVYSDGVELLFFVAAGPQAPAFHVQPGPPPQPDHVRALSIGAWTVLQGDLSGHEVVVMGKQDEQVLADLIRSAFP